MEQQLEKLIKRIVIGMTIKEKKTLKEKLAEKYASQSEGMVFFKGLLMIIIPEILIWVLVPFLNNALFTILAVLSIPVLIFGTLYFYWARNHVFGVFVSEGFCVVITSGDTFLKAIAKCKDYGFDYDWSIIKSNGPGADPTVIKPPWYENILGMSLFLWPFHRVYKYDWSWTKKTESGKIISKQGRLPHILLMPYVYYLPITGAEDTDNMPIDLEIAFEARIKNPYKARFRIDDWLRAIAQIIQGEIRDYVRRYKYDQLISMKEQGESGISKTSLGDLFFQEMEDTRVKFFREYGIHVRKLKILNIIPSNKEYLEATTKRIIAERKREAIEIEADAAAKKRSRESMGSIMHILAEQTGINVKDLQVEFRTNPEEFNKKYSSALAFAHDLVHRQMALDKGGFIDIRSGGKGPGEANNLFESMVAANFIANQKKNNNTVSSPSSVSTFSKKKKNNLFDEEDEDEISRLQDELDD